MSKKILVAYFSASGVTAKVAERLAKIAGGDLYEIKPCTPYTNRDLDWKDKNSRSTIEMTDQSIRPAIVKDLENLADYDTVYVGFPIWWYIAPTIINTFLESYDFAGKKIALFATSGGSNMGKTAEKLKVSAPKAEFVGEKMLNRVSDEEIKAWTEKVQG